MSETTSTSTAPGERGGSQSDLRRYNERVVLQVIRNSPGTFNAELSRRTGLAAQTISVILRSLDEQGLIVRGPVLRGRRGQPATPISINPQGACAIGVESGWRHTCAVATDLAGEVLGSALREHPPLDVEARATVARELAAEIVGQLPREAVSRLTGIGLAIPRGLSAGVPPLHAPGAARSARSMAPVVAALEALCGCEVTTTDDGAAACRAEALAPGAMGGNFAYLFLGNSVAAGFAVNGRAFEGPRGNAANLGSLVVSNGRGEAVMLERVASVAALEARLAAAGHEGLLRLFGDWDWRAAEDIVSAWVDEASVVLAHAIANTGATIEFERFVLDGALPDTLLGLLVERVDAILSRFDRAHFRLPRLVRGRHGLLGAAKGAASLPLHREFFTLDGA